MFRFRKRCVLFQRVEPSGIFSYIALRALQLFAEHRVGTVFFRFQWFSQERRHEFRYIHYLKENEARNIGKWTLEKLLMDQAMGDLQVQLDEIRRMWEEERMQRERAERELEALRSNKTVSVSPEEREGEGGDGKRQRTE